MTTYMLAVDSPFGSLVPNFTVFGAGFTTWWQKLFAGLLAVAIIYCGAKLVVALAGMHRSRESGVSGQVDIAKHQALWASIALGGVISFAALSTALFAAVS